jgi:hypothetical protein
MNIENQSARRYHWHSLNVKDFVCEPHTGIASQLKIKDTLDMAALKSDKTRKISTELVSQNFNSLMKDIKILRKYSTPVSSMASLKLKNKGQLTLLRLENQEFKTHPVISENFSKSKYLEKILWELCDRKPENYEKMLSMKGVGPKTIRALALVSELIYGAKPSYEDPARYSFAHGGKDETPYPVDCKTYDKTIETMKEYVRKSKIPASEKQRAINSLKKTLDILF